MLQRSRPFPANPVLVLAAVVALSAVLLPTAPAVGDDHLPSDPDGFEEVLDFEDYTQGALHGQDAWEASPAVDVVLDPGGETNQVARVPGSADWARRMVPAIADGGTGTVFFRLYRDAPVDHNAGLSAADPPEAFGDYEVQANAQESEALNARDGGSFAHAGLWAQDAWQCVWMVADNATDTYAVYSLGGPYEATTRLPVDDPERLFNFRNGTADSLDWFVTRNGNQAGGGDAFLDDVAIDTTGENLAVPGGNAADKCQFQDVDGPLGNPLADPEPSNLGLVLEEFAQLPESAPTPPPSDQRLVRHNRINHILPVPDGSGRLAVPDLNGTMYLLDEDGNDVEYLDVRAALEDNFHNHAGLGAGFGFVEFHPEFAENGKFYTVHTETGADENTDLPDFGSDAYHSILTEWTADDPASNTFSGTHREVLRIGYATRIHTMQQISFNPTAAPGDEDYGLLYVLSGDGGNGFGTDNPQDLSTPQGKILRIDPAGSDSSNGQYGIPASNPFVDEPGALGEIYAVGMRDPHRISWDRAGDHQMFLGHIGQWRVESIYDVRAGDNFGWSEREGPFRVDDGGDIYPLPEDDDTHGYTYPVAAYDHDRDPGETGDAGIAVAGGHVYRGDDVPHLAGRYVFTDLVRGHVYATHIDEMERDRGLATIDRLKVFVDGQETTFAELVGDPRIDLRSGTDADGELYFVAKASGQIWKVTGARTSAAEDLDGVLPTLWEDTVAYYDFDHASPDDATFEQDQGRSGTDIELVNGGEAMRVADEAYPGAGSALETGQVDTQNPGNDDWKAGIYDADGVASLRPFNEVEEITLMGWFKPTGENPGYNTNTSNPDDRYNAIGLSGVLSGTSEGHLVRALLEVISVDGEMTLVALGRRIDTGSSWIFAADAPLEEILVPGEWVHLAATFDFDGGAMQIFMNGQPLAGQYTSSADPWGVAGDGPFATSPTDPTGIKIGGSYPQNNQEANPCNCHMDDLIFLDRVPSAEEIAAQYDLFVSGDDPGGPGKGGPPCDDLPPHANPRPCRDDDPPPGWARRPAPPGRR